MTTKSIRIIKGTFGFWDEKRKVVVPKTEKDGPFLLSEERAKELVEQGIAEYTDVPQTPDVEPEPEADGAEKQPIDLDEMTVEQLKEVAEPYGIKYKVGTKKADFVAEIREAMEESEAEEDGEDAPPEFNAEDAVQ